MSDTAAPVSRPAAKPRPRLTSYLLVIALAAFTVFAARQIGLKWSSFVDMWTNPLWDRFWPVPWDWVFNRRNVFDPLIETFQIAIISTVIGCTLGAADRLRDVEADHPERPDVLAVAASS